VAKVQHIVVVDGHPEVGDTLRNALEYSGYRVSLEANDRQVRSILLFDTVDLLIADVYRGSNAGVALADRAERLGIPSLLISADAERMAELEASQRPFLAKPFRVAKFTEVISKILAKPKENGRQ
jgi:DNA-binding NtrC family response regulator